MSHSSTSSYVDTITIGGTVPMPVDPRYDIADAWTCEIPDFLSAPPAPAPVLCDARSGFVMQEETL